MNLKTYLISRLFWGARQPLPLPHWAMASSFMKFLDHTQRRTTVGRNLLHEWSAQRRDLYLTTHNTHNRQTSMPRVGFETTISAGERPQTYALDRAATGIDSCLISRLINELGKTLNIKERKDSRRNDIKVHYWSVYMCKIKSILSHYNLFRSRKVKVTSE
jgi:hypothetical protein